MKEENTDEFKKQKFPEYLEKDFSVELNYKLWTTKGARFVASDRVKKIGKHSSYSIGFLTAYVIIINLLSAFSIETIVILSGSNLAFITTGLSILILVFSQLENANEYRLRSEKYHNCALEIGDIYNELRYYKTDKTLNNEVNIIAKELSEKYGSILKKYENHSPIDFELFKTTKNDYFKLNWRTIIFINIKYYFKTYFLYHLLIVVPLLFIIFSMIK